MQQLETVVEKAKAAERAIQALREAVAVSPLDTVVCEENLLDAEAMVVLVGVQAEGWIESLCR